MRIQIAPLLYTLSALVACQPDAPELTASAVAPKSAAPSAPSPGAATPPAPPLAVKAPAWRWTHFGEEAIRRGAGRDVIALGADVIHIDFTINPRRAVVERRERDAGPSAEPRWTFMVDESPFVGAGTIKAAGDVVVVALHSRIASGCTLIGLDLESGARRWEVALKGLGPVSHSKYRNDVQLDVINGQVVVYGWESSGRYIEIVDPKAGRTLHNEQLSPRWSGWSDWGWIGDEEEADAHRAKLLGAAAPNNTRLLPLLNTWQVSHERGQRRWSVQLSPRHVGEPLVGSSGDGQLALAAPAAVAGSDDVVGVLYQLVGRSRGMIVGLNAQDGTQRWETAQVGPSDLSEQAVEGSMGLYGQGEHFIVTGRSVFGAYVEIFDAKTGEGVWREVWRD